ncbi:HlyD family efflux transporter periplasmic adaptor subunit [Novipirellula sp. SH528]|uniref:HlyD family efflux transporter periplasmic adaptor subunit n=1 Tax=Novipirellula sp. SH528 TaxID=3454466 RepID=UPI003FA107FD
MRTEPLSYLTVLALSLFTLLPSLAEEAEKKSADDTSKEQKAVKIDGVFESLSSHEIAANSEQIDSYVIKRILPHGAAVKKDAAVVWFETKEIDEKISKAEFDLALAKLASEEADFSFEQFREQQELDRKAAELTRKEARQAYDNYVDVDREQQIMSAEFQLKRSEESLEYAEEELNQLQKMYEEDDLTEESEEIVLKRARRAVEQAKYSLELAKTRTQRTLEQTIPSQLEKEKATLARAELAFAKTVQDLKAARLKRDIERRRQKTELEKQQTDFKALQAERRGLVLSSPIDGLVYHGQLTRGKLGDKASTFDVKSKVTARQVVATIVQPDRLRITADISEDQRAKVNVGMKGSAIPKAFPELKIPVTIQSIAKVPYAANKIECVLVINGKVKNAELVPGMTSSIEFEKAGKE